MVTEILEVLSQCAHEGTRKRYEKIKEIEPYIGIPMGELRKLAKQYKGAFDVVMPLWQTGILDAQYLAILIAKPNQLSDEDILICLSDNVSINVLDKFNDLILSKRHNAKQWKEKLKQSNQLYRQRLGWGLEVRYLVTKQATTEELQAIYQTIETQLVESDELVKWTMNRCLVELAVNYPEWLEKCRNLGETLGVYRDMVVPKGCTSAYAPDWIAALLKNRRIDV